MEKYEDSDSAVDFLISMDNNELYEGVTKLLFTPILTGVKPPAAEVISFEKVNVLDKKKIVLAAVTKIIRQHFIYEILWVANPLKEGSGHWKTIPTGNKKIPCNDCRHTPLKRRFRTRPRELRNNMYKRVWDVLVELEQRTTTIKQKEAIKLAEEAAKQVVHSWMDYAVSFEYVRVRRLDQSEKSLNYALTQPEEYDIDIL